MAASNSEWMVAAAKVASNSKEVSEATVEGKLAASLAGSVEDKWVTDSDCWLVTVARNVAETLADKPRWRYLEARISDTAIDTAAARVPEDRQVVVARKTTDTPETTDGFAVTEWVAIARCISVGSRNRDCCRDCFRSTRRPGKILHLLSVRSELSRAGTAGNAPRVAPVEIPERN